MTFQQLQEKSYPHFYSLAVDRFFPKAIRGFLRKASALLALLSFGVSLFDSLPLYFGRADGFFFLFVFIYLCLSFLEFFYKSMKNEGLAVRIFESLLPKSEYIDYSLSKILRATDEIDVTRALLSSEDGFRILLRSGISKESAKHFLYDSKRNFIMASVLNLGGESIGLSQYAGSVYDADKSLQVFLSQNSVNREEFVGAAEWISDIEQQKMRRDRFWSRENLGAIPSIGTSWSYGQAPDLGKFGVPFGNRGDFSSLDIDNGYRKKEIALLEGILNRRSEANAIIIDDDQKIAQDIVLRLLKKMKLGVSLPGIEHKEIIELDWSSLTATFKNKSDLEAELIKILNESVGAGNIMLYIRDLAGFSTSIKALGISLPSILSPYLSSSRVQIIASATNADFHFFIESSPALLEGFERIIPEPAGIKATMSALLEQVPGIEKQYGIIFSYPAVLNIATSADRFLNYGEMPDKALDLMIEIAPWAAQKNIDLVKENDINIFISEKTGIATGVAKGGEAQKIGNLEEILHKRVIGQNEAVEGVADAVRRSRSGVGNPKRPIASFLFVGPTGVGKTEVSKALAESYFGDEKNMIRFDMSEYNGPEAISELIGDFTLSKSGLLASRVRDNPYSVLLLDEFEKASPDVLDLFLQILDEGVFTDAMGKHTLCRNLIIIATSNAGSDLIWEKVKAGKDLAKEKDNILNEIIRRKIFRPELLNRFDGIIMFHPLEKEDLRSIARLGLQKLANRMKERDVELAVGEDVVEYLVNEKSDPEFGGRSINRAIQNDVENLVARKMLSGEVKPGSKMVINRVDLQNA